MKLGPDEVAIDLWQKIGMPPERIVPLPTSENFWSVGGPGPCGPDSEIYWDWGEEHGCGEPDCAPACTRCDRFLEFWNLVFMEYELHADGTADAAAEAEHRHGPRASSAARRSSRTSARSTRRTATSRSWSWIAAESGRRVRRLAGGDEGAPDPRRSRPRDDVPRRRRRDAVERGPRLRPAPHHPARRAAGAAHRAARRPSPVRGRRRADGRRVSGARARAADEIARVAAPRGGALRRDARARAQALRGARLPGRDLGRAGVHARGDVRLPGGAHGRARGGARPGRRPGRLPHRDGAPPRGLARRAVRASCSARPISRGARTSRRSSSGTRRPTCSRRSVRSRSSTTGTSSRSFASRRSIRPAAAR